VRSSAACFNLQYRLVSLKPATSYLRLLRLPITSIIPSVFPSIACFRRQFLRKMRPIELAFCACVCVCVCVCVCAHRMFLSSLTPSNTSFSHTNGPTYLLHSSSVPHFKTFQVYVNHTHKKIISRIVIKPL